jgi:hypothetical protein
MFCMMPIGKPTSITASATWATQNAPSILERLLPPVGWDAARYSRMAECAVLGVRIPSRGAPAV